MNTQTAKFILFDTQIIDIENLMWYNFKGNTMNNDSNITKNNSIIFVGRMNIQPHCKLTHNLKYNELIHHINGQSTVHFNEKFWMLKKTQYNFCLEVTV